MLFGDEVAGAEAAARRCAAGRRGVLRRGRMRQRSRVRTGRRLVMRGLAPTPKARQGVRVVLAGGRISTVARGGGGGGRRAADAA